MEVILPGEKTEMPKNMKINEIYKTAGSLVPLPSITEKPTKVLECDEKTPDAHVPRDSRLIRLTGIHPFNCEPPLTDLYSNGFITPTELWFVRNHGLVPNVSDDEFWQWSFTIEGLVEKPMTMTLQELLKLPQITLPITMVCAGNRRKEQNVVRKGKGFNWGSAGVSTALFTGVLMRTVLDLAKPKSNARYMCMEGADELPNGFYGTSIRLSTAMDPMMGVMLSHLMNGELLTPDHGRPLRVVIPAQIGGRSVKWLTRIIISEKPSENWYHIFDNRVLPTMITPEIADEEKFWYKDERYALYNLNVQSVICRPAHDETIKVDVGRTYTVQGYAYNGGGVRVGRVEVSLNQGQTWRLASIDYPEDLYRQAEHISKIFGGKLDMSEREHSFCWCFWKIDIPTSELCSAEDIVVRAMDESMNIQPRDLYWNVLSMLNNCWHRVTITKVDFGAKLCFEHPTIPAATNGGWMEKVVSLGGNLRDGFWGSRSSLVKNTDNGNNKTVVKMTNDSVKRIITQEELTRQKQNGAAWFVVDGHVYDATDYLKEHPGGVNSITAVSGEDATEDFMAIHSDISKNMMPKYHIGILKPGSSLKHINGHVSNNEIKRVFLTPKQWTYATLKSKVNINHDSIFMTFTMEHPNQKLGIPIGNSFYIRCISKTQEKIVRPYTPWSDDRLGEFDIVVKLYRATRDRPAGKMSACFDHLKPGDKVECKGPMGDYQYIDNGKFLYNNTFYETNRFTMVTGGSGITGIYPILKRACNDGIECDVIYCVRTEEDILMRDDLDKINRIRYCLSKPSPSWKGLRGRISEEMIGKPHGGFLLCCGPTGFVESVREIAKNLGWNVENEVFTV